MNTPVWVVVAVAAFGGVQWLVRLLTLLRDLNTADAAQLQQVPDQFADHNGTWRLRMVNGVKVWECDGPVRAEDRPPGYRVNGI